MFARRKVRIRSIPFARASLSKSRQRIEVNSDLIVYRFSQPNTLLYLEKKVARLSKGGVIDKSRTLARELAKDGLMGEGKEKLLEGRPIDWTTAFFMLKSIRQRGGLSWPVIWSPSTSPQPCTKSF